MAGIEHQSAANRIETIAELRSRLEQAKRREERFSILYSLISQLLKGNPAEAVQYCREALRIALHLDDPEMLAKACLLMGVEANIRSRHKRAQKYYKQAWSLAKNLPDSFPLKARICRDLGYNYCHQGDTYSAMEVYAVSLKYARQSEIPPEVAGTLTAIGESYFNLGMVAKALAALKEALRIYRESSLQSGRIIVLLNLARIYGTLNDNKNALGCIKEGLHLSRQLGDRRMETFSLEHLGMYYTGRGDYDRAIRCYSGVAERYKAIGDRLRHGFIFGKLADAYRGKGEYGAAIRYIEMAEAVFDLLGNRVALAIVSKQKMQIFLAQEEWKNVIEAGPDLLQVLGEAGLQRSQISAHQGLAQAYEKVGDYNSSLLHYKRFVEIEKELLGNDVRRQIVALQAGALIDERNLYREKSRQLEREIEERSRELASQSMRIAHTNEFLEQLRTRLCELKRAGGDTPGLVDAIIGEINERTGRVDVWNTFEQQLRLLDQAFVHSLTTACPALTPAEIRLCLLLKLNLANKEIAALLNVSTRTLDAQRMSIRRKLGLEKGANLVTFLEGIG